MHKTSIALHFHSTKAQNLSLLESYIVDFAPKTSINWMKTQYQIKQPWATGGPLSSLERSF